MRRNHAAEVSALAEVVRASLAEVVASGRSLAEPKRGALACVERWLALETVSKEELESAREEAHETRATPEERERDRSLSWANAAIGNLAWMATKPRGWQDGPRVVMDAAVCAVTSIEGSSDPRERFEALHVEALARALESAPLPKTPKAELPPAGGPPRKLSGELVPFIGSVASARLRRVSAVVDPSKRADDAALKALMKHRRYTLYEPVLAFERRYGGLVAPDGPGQEGNDFVFGAFACLSGERSDAPRGGVGHEGAKGKRALIPVVRSPNDVVYFLDGHGAAWAQDTLENPGALLFARDGDRMVARILLFQILSQRRFDGAFRELEGKRGEEIAAALGIPLVPEASDHLARVWADDRAVVIEQRLLVPGPVLRGPWQTLVAGRDRKKIERVVPAPPEVPRGD